MYIHPGATHPIPRSFRLMVTLATFVIELKYHFLSMNQSFSVHVVPIFFMIYSEYERLLLFKDYSCVRVALSLQNLQSFSSLEARISQSGSTSHAERTTCSEMCQRFQTQPPLFNCFFRLSWQMQDMLTLVQIAEACLPMRMLSTVSAIQIYWYAKLLLLLL